MFSRIVIISIIVLAIVNTCIDNQSTRRESTCDSIVGNAPVNLKGVGYINTKGEIIFHESNLIQDLRYGRKMHLIPCNNHIKEYLFNEYDIFLYLKKHEDYFWISIEGEYLTTDTLRHPQEFLLKSVVITIK